MMPDACAVCAHAECAVIESRIVDGTPTLAIADEFGVSAISVEQHAAAHCRDARTAQLSGLAPSDRDLLTRIQGVSAEVLAIFREQRAAGNVAFALLAATRIEKLADLEARLRGELQSSSTINVLMSPQWIRLQGALLDILAPHPELRVQVARTFAAISDGRES